MTEASSNQAIAEGVEKAVTRIQKYVLKTPLVYSAHLSQKTGVNTFLKLESEQLSGAFKARGAFNKVHKQYENQGSDGAEKKIYTASSGNHGLAMTLAQKSVGKRCIVYVPKNVAKAKEENLRLHDADVRKEGDDCILAELAAIKAAKEEGGIYISPYNDLDVIAGQGTIMYEILQDCKDVDAIFVTVGGGGLIGGISSYAKHINPKIKVVGCSPVNSNPMEESIKAGKQIDIVDKDTLADGSAGNIEIPSITFPICQRNVDRWVNVTEEEIADAIYLMLDAHHKLVEGAAGVALASLLKVKDDFQGQKVAVVICGSNIGMEKLKKIINDRT